MVRSLLMLLAALMTGIPTGICVCGVSAGMANLAAYETAARSSTPQKSCCHHDCADEIPSSDEPGHIPGCPADDARITDLSAPPVIVSLDLMPAASQASLDTWIPEPSPRISEASSSPLAAAPPPFLAFRVLLI
ncbi:MAG: hypothetical protein LC104_05870 [Bacteroidales bacterium]|nr:hypothetical protein [Bacteroidales bacterium]